MRHKVLNIGMLAGVLGVFVLGAIAQHEVPDSRAQAQTQSPTQPQPGMMGGGMMGMMSQMMNQNHQMSDMMAKMTQNMSAMQNEKDPSKRKALMADQHAMLEQMRSEMMQQGGMMQNMSGMMMKSCPAAVTSADNGAQNVMGTVKAISASSITIERMGKDHASLTVALLPSTKFIKGGAATSVKDLKVENRVVVTAKPNANGDKFDAVSITFGKAFEHMDMHHK